VVAVVVVVIGVVLVVLAHDIRSWRNTLHDDAFGYSVFLNRQERLTASTVFPSSISGHLLSVGRNRDWLRALTLFRRAYDETLNVEALDQPTYAVLNDGQGALAKVTQDPDPVRASQAYDLLAVLAFREAHPGQVVDAGLVQAAATDLQNAVRLDGANERAKVNLELVLRVLLAATPARVANPSAPASSTTNKRKGGHGTPGVGY
jgi:hypothetical protein